MVGFAIPFHYRMVPGEGESARGACELGEAQAVRAACERGKTEVVRNGELIRQLGLALVSRVLELEARKLLGGDGTTAR